MKDINKWKQINELNEFNLPNFPIKDFPNKLREYIEAVAEELQVPIFEDGKFVYQELSVKEIRD